MENLVKEIDIQDKQQVLLNIIDNLSKEKMVSQSMMELIGIYIKELQDVYSVSFRHHYSEILVLLSQMEQDRRDYLNENLFFIREFIISNEQKYDKQFIKSFEKLYDHISLETTRMTQLQEFKAFSDDVRKAQEKISDLHENINRYALDSEVKFTKSEEKFSNFNTQSIAILSIFAGVVMTFFGGMSFLTATLNNIDKVTKYKIFFSILLIGFIVFNTIFLLLNVVGKLTSRSIENKCKTDGCTCTIKCNFFKRTMNKFPVFFHVNLFIILAMVLLTAIWGINKHYNLGI